MIRFLQAWNGYPVNAIVDLPNHVENALIAAIPPIASRTLTGGFTWYDNKPYEIGPANSTAGFTVPLQDGTAPALLTQAQVTATQALVSADGMIAAASGSSAAASNVAAINSVLATGGNARVYAADGVCWVDSDLIISRDNSAVITAPGTRLRFVSGTRATVLRTSLTSDAGTTVTLAWTAGPVATMTWTAHPLAVGDGVILQGATVDVWRQVARVVSVTNANTVVLALRRAPSAAPSGTITAWRCLRNVRVDVDVDYNWDNVASGAQGITRHAVVLAGLVDSDVKVFARNAYKYGLQLMGCLDTQWWAAGDNVSDCAKVYGPSAGLRGRISGVSRDDTFSLQAQEPAAFIAYQRFIGPLYDCDTELATTSMATGASSGACVLYTDTTHKSDGIKFRGSAMSQLRGGVIVKVGDDWIGSESTSVAGQVVVEDMTLAPVATFYALAASCAVEQFVVTRPRIVPGDGATQLFRLESTSNIKHFVLDGWNFQNTGWPSAATQTAINLNGTVQHAEFINNRVTGAASFYRHINVGTGGTVSKITIRGGNFDGGNCVVLVPTGVTSNPTIVFDGVRIANFTNVLRAQAACTVVFRNCDFDTVSFVVATLTNVINVRIVDGGGNKFTSSPLIQCLNSSTVTCYGQELPVTLSTTGVQKTVRGQFCTSATAVGTILAGSPVVCDGTNWRALEDRTLLF